MRFVRALDQRLASFFQGGMLLAKLGELGPKRFFFVATAATILRSHATGLSLRKRMRLKELTLGIER